MAKYKLSEAAKSDMRRIYAYGLRQFGEAQADTYYNDLFDRFEAIADAPLMYPAEDDLRVGYRRSLCGVDNIYYRIVEGTVEIVRILGRQNRSDYL